MAVTLNDIAKLANVDKSTVSMTLRNHPNSLHLRQETREKIRKLAKDLGYCSNENAISLRTGRIRIIALIAEDAAQDKNAFISVNLSGLIHAASAKGYGIKVFTDQDLKATFRKINADRLSLILSLSIDPEKREETAFLAEKMGLDLVFLFERPHGKYPSINVDNLSGASSAVAYLASMGHKRIGYISTGSTYKYQEERCRGFLEGLADASLKKDPSFILYGKEEIEEDIVRILSLPPRKRPTALFCSTDALAIRVQHIALQLGLSLPDELSIIGFSNSHFCDLAAVPLTSMDENFNERALLAVKVLLKEIPEKDYPANGCFLVPSGLVERKSVKKITNKVKTQYK